MKLVRDILWLILGGGILIAFLYVVGGILLCLTIIGIPFGFQSFKLAGMALRPFDREVIPIKVPASTLSLIMNLIWIFIAGLEIAVAHLVLALLMGITIIGMPFARQHMKLVTLSLLPFGHRPAAWQHHPLAFAHQAPR